MKKSVADNIAKYPWILSFFNVQKANFGTTDAKKRRKWIEGWIFEN